MAFLRLGGGCVATCFAIALLFLHGHAAAAPPRAPDLSLAPPGPVSIAMMGDSITRGGRWSELLGREDVSNHGVVGNSSAQIVNRMEDVYRHNPRICFIMAGVNDIAGGVPVEEVFTNIRLMVQGLRVRQIIPVLQSTLYTRIPRYNRRIEKLNGMLAAYSREFKVDFVDLNASLSHDRLLERMYTFDGIHLRPTAYEQWRRELQRTLNRHNVRTAEVRSEAPFEMPSGEAPGMARVPAGG